MLDHLFGTKTVERLLLYLFVNGGSYGAEMSRAFRAPLTPIQSALKRLERGGILLSLFRGKTKVFQLSPSFPLFPELEALLKKRYVLLSSEEKQLLHQVKNEEGGSSEERLQTLLAFWERLSRVKGLNFHAKSKNGEGEGWNGNGKGEIEARSLANQLEFKEKGSWRDRLGKEFGFSNQFRWTLDRRALVVTLEHLRRGAENPVFLFHLSPYGKNALRSLDSHFCAEDTYFGQIHFDEKGIRFSWRVIGPKKNEEIDYYYT